MRLRDNQRSKLYDWERINVWPHYTTTVGFLSLAECTLLAQWGMSHFHMSQSAIDKVRIRPGRACRRAIAFGDNRIELPRWARNIPVVLHEVSHTITWHFIREHAKESLEPHGPEYLRVYIHLLAKSNNPKVTEKALIESAKAVGLRVASDSWLRQFKSQAKIYAS